MIKKAILPLLLVAALSLTACGAKEEAGTSNYTGKEVVEVAEDSAKPDGDKIVAEVTYEDGKPVDVNLDIKMADGTMKSELSKEGKYVMKEGEANAWHKQLDMLEDFIKTNNFDIMKVNITDDAGHTDAVSGVSVKVKAFVDVVEKNLDQVKNK